MFNWFWGLFKKKDDSQIEMERWDTTSPTKETVQDTLPLQDQGQRSLEEWGS